MPSTRRALLASASLGLAGLAGCGGRGGGATTSTTTSTPTAAAAAATLGESVTLDGTTVTVDGLAAVHSYQYLAAPDAFGVESAGDGRFAFVGVTADGDDPPEPTALALDVAGDRIAPSDRTRGPTRDLAPVGEGRYTRDSPTGYLLFRVPAPLDADSAAVVLADRARWSIPDGRLAPFRRPAPAFSVDYDVPGAVGREEPVPLRLDLTNTGDSFGVCRGALNHHGPMHGGDTFSVSLDAGASATHEEVIDYHVGREFGVDRLRFEVVLPGESRTFEVRLEGGSAGTATPS